MLAISKQQLMRLSTSKSEAFASSFLVFSFSFESIAITPQKKNGKSWYERVDNTTRKIPNSTHPPHVSPRNLKTKAEDKKSSRNRTHKNTPWWGSNIKRKEVKDYFFRPILKFLQNSSTNIKSSRRTKKWRSWYAGMNDTNTHWKFRQLCLDQKIQQLSTEYLLDTTMITPKNKKSN